jgi:hypothetical protein
VNCLKKFKIIVLRKLGEIQGNNSRTDLAEERICELEGKLFENIVIGEKKEKNKNE